MEDLRHRMLKATLPERRARIGGGRIGPVLRDPSEAPAPRRAARPGLYHVVKKGSSNGTPRISPTIPSATSLLARRSCHLRQQKGRDSSAEMAAMSDRKYRQRGYQDDDRDRRSQLAATPRRPPAPEPGAPAGRRRISQDGPKNINMPGYREVVRCAQCGNLVVGRDLGGDALPAVRRPICTPARSARRSIRAADSSACSRSRPGVAEERAQRLHPLQARARPSSAKRRRPKVDSSPQGVRRPVQVLRLEPWLLLLSDQDRQTRRRRTWPGLTHAGHAAVLHADDRRARDGAHRHAGARRGRRAQRPLSRSKRSTSSSTGAGGAVRHRRMSGDRRCCGRRRHPHALPRARRPATSSCRSSRRSFSPARDDSGLLRTSKALDRRARDGARSTSRCS